jgi:hypothetical protein
LLRVLGFPGVELENGWARWRVDVPVASFPDNGRPIAIEASVTTAGVEHEVYLGTLQRAGTTVSVSESVACERLDSFTALVRASEVTDQDADSRSVVVELADCSRTSVDGIAISAEACRNGVASVWVWGHQAGFDAATKVWTASVPRAAAERWVGAPIRVEDECGHEDAVDCLPVPSPRSQWACPELQDIRIEARGLTAQVWTDKDVTFTYQPTHCHREVPESDYCVAAPLSIAGGGSATSCVEDDLPDAGRGDANDAFGRQDYDVVSDTTPDANPRESIVCEDAEVRYLLETIAPGAVEEPFTWKLDRDVVFALAGADNALTVTVVDGCGQTAEAATIMLEPPNCTSVSSEDLTFRSVYEAEVTGGGVQISLTVTECTIGSEDCANDLEMLLVGPYVAVQTEGSAGRMWRVQDGPLARLPDGPPSLLAVRGAIGCRFANHLDEVLVPAPDDACPQMCDPGPSVALTALSLSDGADEERLVAFRASGCERGEAPCQVDRVQLEGQHAGRSSDGLWEVAVEADASVEELRGVAWDDCGCAGAASLDLSDFLPSENTATDVTSVELDPERPSYGYVALGSPILINLRATGAFSGGSSVVIEDLSSETTTFGGTTGPVSVGLTGDGEAVGSVVAQFAEPGIKVLSVTAEEGGVTARDVVTVAGAPTMSPGPDNLFAGDTATVVVNGRGDLASCVASGEATVTGPDGEPVAPRWSSDPPVELPALLVVRVPAAAEDGEVRIACWDSAGRSDEVSVFWTDPQGE